MPLPDGEPLPAGTPLPCASGYGQRVAALGGTFDGCGGGRFPGSDGVVGGCANVAQENSAGLLLPPRVWSSSRAW